MGLYNRAYRQEGGSHWGGGGGSFGYMTSSQFTPVVKWLMIINTGMFVLQSIFQGRHFSIEWWLAAIAGMPGSEHFWWQVWRLITFQFLHGSLGHLVFNMISLFFFGHIIERTWGSRRFLAFYLFCGAFGGLVFMLGSQITPRIGGVLVGASGGILGVLAAGAILYPQITVFLFPIPIPIKIRWLLAAYLGWYLMSVLTGRSNAGGDLCHLGGMAAAFIWIKGQPIWDWFAIRRERSATQKLFNDRAKLQYEVDRILAKVHEHGIHSLTRKEKQILQDATEQQRKTGF